MQAYLELSFKMAPVWIYGDTMMQTILMLAGFIQATVLLGFWGAALVLLISGIAILIKLLSPFLIKILFTL